MPDVSTVHVDMPLTEVSIAYQNPDFVTDRIFPPLGVGKQTNKYWIYGREGFKPEDDLRAPGAEANEIRWELSSDSYSCQGHALKDAIPDELRANADSPINPDIDSTEFLTQKIYLNREIALAATVFSGTYITQTAALSGTDMWDDYSGSQPFANAETAKETVRKAIGRSPNVLLIGPAVWAKLKHHPSLLKRLSITNLQVLTPALVAEALELDEVLIGYAQYDTVNEGVTTKVMADVWGKSALFFYRAPRVTQRVVTLGLQFRWAFGMNTQGFLVKRWREEKRTADMIEAQLYYDNKLTVAAAGYLYTNVVT